MGIHVQTVKITVYITCFEIYIRGLLVNVLACYILMFRLCNINIILFFPLRWNSFQNLYYFSRMRTFVYLKVYFKHFRKA